MPKTPAQRQADYYKRQIERGFKMVTVWLKADKIKELREFARKISNGGNK